MVGQLVYHENGNDPPVLKIRGSTIFNIFLSLFRREILPPLLIISESKFCNAFLKTTSTIVVCAVVVCVVVFEQ